MLSRPLGAAGMFMWLSNGLATFGKDGKVRSIVGHALGAQKKEDATSYAQSSIQIRELYSPSASGILSVVFVDEMNGFFS